MPNTCLTRDCPICLLKARLNRFFFGPLRVLFYGSLFTIYALIGNFIQLLTLLLLPWNHAILIHAHLCGILWWAMQFVFEKMQKGRFLVTGDAIPVGAGNALILSNHTGYADFFYINHLATRAKMVSHCKYIIKESCKWIPGFGWGMWLMGMIFLRRSIRHDKDRLERGLQRLLQANNPLWLILYPEGGRIDTERRVKSQEFARDRNLPELENVLCPRTKGFLTVIHELRKTKQVENVYDLTLSCYHKKYGHCKPPTLYEIFAANGLHDFSFRIHVKRYMLDELPHDEKSLKNWLHDRFQEKDLILKDWTSLSQD